MLDILSVTPMQNITSITGTLTTIGGVLIAVLAFGFLIFIHELGHFILAKRSGVQVNEFALGMGPKIFSKTKNGTTYSLRLFPIGGFVAMEGEHDESHNKASFGQASLWNKAKIMLAGAMVNLLFGLLLMSVITGVQIKKDGGIGTTQIVSFSEDSLTSQWLKAGDTIVAINGKKTKTTHELSYRLSQNIHGIMDMTVIREEKKIELEKVEFPIREVKPGLEVLVIDFFVNLDDSPTILQMITYTLNRTSTTMRQIGSSFISLVTGQLSVNELSGPVGITKEMTTLSATRDWLSFFYFVAMLSLNLGILNLLPFPALDGGRLLLLTVEAVSGKSINEKLEMTINLVGIMLLFGLMIVVSLNDIQGLFH